MILPINFPKTGSNCKNLNSMGSGSSLVPPDQQNTIIKKHKNNDTI